MQLFNGLVSGSGGAADFSSMLGGTAGRPADLASILGGAAASTKGLGGGLSGNEFASAVGGLAFGAAGSAFGIPPELSGKIGAALGGLFGGHKTDEVAQSSAINTIAAHHGVTPAEAGAVVAWHADHSSDHFDDLAASVARPDGLSRFVSLLQEYNSGNPSAPIVLGSVRRAAAEAASSQQQLITTALTSPSFVQTATGQQFINSLQALPASQSLGTQGQTAGDILGQIVKGIGNGALKGGSDAAAETTVGKSLKKDYIKTWAKENQLLAAGIGAFGVFGLVELYKKFAGKGGKISL